MKQRNAVLLGWALGTSASASLVLALLALSVRHANASFIDDTVNWVGNRVLNVVLPGSAFIQPRLLKVMEGVAVRRSKRGDKEGAAHIRQMKQWFNFLGIKKGVAALTVQFWNNSKALADTWGLVLRTAHNFQQKAMEVGPLEAWQSQYEDISSVTKSVMSKLTKAIKTGPVLEFLKDLSFELTRDHLVRDVLEEILPSKHQRQLLSASVDSFVRVLRTAVEAGLKVAGGGRNGSKAARHEEL